MSESNQLWIDKYKPKNTSEFTSNSVAISNIVLWLSKFPEKREEILKRNKLLKKNGKKITKKRTSRNDKTNNSFKSCLIVTGNHGIGKTVAVELVLKSLDYDVRYLNFNNAKNGKQAKDMIQTILCSTNIADIMQGKPIKKSVIIVDKIETIISQTEKTNLILLQRENELKWHMPIIFISNNKHVKLLSELKKTCTEIKFYPPSNDTLRDILLKITKNENINITEELVIDKIIDYSQADVRQLIFMLQDLHCTYNNEQITEEIIEKYIKTTKTKDIEINIYDATDKLLNNYSSVNNCLELYETEKVLMPLMMHQNYYANILSRKFTKKQTLDVISSITEALSFGDIVDNYVFCDQSWDMQEIHGFYTCVLSSYFLNQYGSQRKYYSKRLNAPKIGSSFTADLNKASTKNINKKNIGNTEKCFKNKSVFDYVYINKLLQKLINNNEMEKCAELLSGYDVKLEQIDSLLKIDKINPTKTSLSIKQKKELTGFLKN